MANLQWMNEAKCADGWVDPELFFDPQTVVEAKTFCNDCPVRNLCFETAFKDPYIQGVWGGTTEVEREKIRKAVRHDSNYSHR